MVEDSCAPHTGKNGKCSSYAKCEPIAKVAKTSFVGGGYGMATEKAMMKEIMHSGAIDGEANWPETANLYKSGILTPKGLQKLDAQI